MKGTSSLQKLNHGHVKKTREWAGARGEGEVGREGALRSWVWVPGVNGRRQGVQAPGGKTVCVCTSAKGRCSCVCVVCNLRQEWRCPCGSVVGERGKQKKQRMRRVRSEMRRTFCSVRCMAGPAAATTSTTGARTASMGATRRTRRGAKPSSRTRAGPVKDKSAKALFFWFQLWQSTSMMMMNKAGAKPSLLCVLLQPTTTYINRGK